jgi:hypothetical protein
LLNSEIVGRIVPDQSWGFRFKRYSEDAKLVADGKLPALPLRYPTQLAEMLLGFAVLDALYLFDKRLGKEKRPRGALISMFFLLYFTGRFCVEFYKEYENNGGMPLGLPITMGQLLSLPGIAIGIIGLILSFKKRIPVGWPNLDALKDEEDEPAPKKRRKRDEEAKKQDEDDDSEREGDEDDRDDKRDEDDDEDEGAQDEDADERDEDDGDQADEDEHGDDAESDAEKPSVDPDVAAEFDEKGSLKRRRD